ncbi:PilZ domain-containing protein [Novosphingobium sp.]|uniref:PilZ domain-containing protein n=1 Tax=Novosphingobium sp. TaxID=1874826 RepID=UPI0025DF024B|nr:PilZ domain-containing protein [Novosphingobium sp.]MCC6925368.1 PilZ domain-containing protein [Novosphingobium sp.]
MSQEAQFQQTSGRRADRRRYQASVQFRAGTRRANVQVQDISELGARISGVFLVHEGDHFYLKLASIEAIECKVAWVTDFEFGCEFIRPLNPVILDAITRSN